MKIVSASPRRMSFLKFLTVITAFGLALALTSAPQQVSYAQAASPQAAPAQATPAQDTSAQQPPEYFSPIEKAEKDGTAIRLSLKDLTKLALQNNLDIAIQDTNEELYQQRLVQTYGPYDPAITAGLGVQGTKSANTNLATASTQGSFNSNDLAYWNFGFSQNFKTGGGLTANWNTRRTDTNQAFALFSPQYSANFQVQFTQPLRQNFRIDANRNNIRLANLNMKMNDVTFKQQVVTTIAGIQGVYWDLVAAIGQYDIARQSVVLAWTQLRDNRKKVEIGTLAPIEITSAQATMAQREGDLISAEENIFRVENNLRSKISSDRNADVWRKIIIPVDTPEFKEYKIDLNQSIDTALQNRPELETIALTIRQADLNYQFGVDQRKWRVDLVGTFGSNGVAGPQAYNDSGTPLNRPELVGGMGTAYKTVFTGGFTSWSVGFQLQIPLKNRSLEAQLAQVQIGKRQNLMQRKNTEQSIQVDVRNAVQSLETNKKRVDQSQMARKLAQEQLDGEQKRFQAGLSQNFLVLQRQGELSQAQFAELQALIAYRKAIITLQQSMYTLLESNDFEIAKTSSDNVAKFK